MRTRIICITLIVIALIVGFASGYYFCYKADNNTPNTPTTVEVVQPPAVVEKPQEEPPQLTQEEPCASIPQLTQLADEAEKAAITANINLKAAIDKCVAVNNVKITAPAGIVTTKKAVKPNINGSKSTDTQKVPETETKTTGFWDTDQNRSNDPVEFCVNVHNMNPASYWPQLAADAGRNISMSVPNKTEDGLNIRTYPTNDIQGDYGATTDGRLYVKVDQLRIYNPTSVYMNGGTSGWDSSWRLARLEGLYYVAYP